jgi:predicted methyltransferase
MWTASARHWALPNSRPIWIWCSRPRIITICIVDHHAVAGSPLTASDAVHRIDIEAVKREVTAAGFVLDGESDILANPADPRTASVFDPSIRGRTSQFMLRFKKLG